MKTIIIWDDCQGEIQFLVVDKDVSHLNGVYVNGALQKEEDEDELIALTWNEVNQSPIPMSKEFPLDVAREPDTKVIVAGFVP